MKAKKKYLCTVIQDQSSYCKCQILLGEAKQCQTVFESYVQKKQKASDENLCILGYLLETAYVMQEWGHIWVGY